MLHRYSLNQSHQECFEEAIRYINEELCCKVALDWNCEEMKQHYSGNPIEDGYTCKGIDQYQWAVQHRQVFTFYLSLMSYYKNYFDVDGFYLTGIDSLASSTEGLILLKCINILKDRLSEHGITLASSKNKIPAMSLRLLEGGAGIMYSINS